MNWVSIERIAKIGIFALVIAALGGLAVNYLVGTDKLGDYFVNIVASLVMMFAIVVYHEVWYPHRKIEI